MAVNLDQVINELEAGLVPDDILSLTVTLETLPDLFSTLTRKLDELSAWAGGTGFHQISSDVLEIIKPCDAARQAAEDAAVSPQAAFLAGS